MTRSKLRIACSAIALAVSSACSDRAATPEGSSPADAGTDRAVDGGEASLGDAPATVRTALVCGSDPRVGPGPGAGLQRFDLDTKRFPDALCNDGSGAAFYFRPYRGEANRNKWLVNLHGGGACSTGESCAARWCSCDSKAKCPFAAETTNFSRGTMIGAGPPTMSDDGIYLRDDAARPNLLGDYNQVIFEYCSSDLWRGSARAVELSAVHPETGAPVTYALHFLGARILDADLATLRQDGVAPLVFSQGGANIAMPDLDDADEVVVTGDSAGGGGVVTNLDHVNDLLRSRNTKCSGASCPLRVWGLIDAKIGPDMSKLDYGAYGAEAIRSYDALLAASAKGAYEATSRHDASCLSWHAANKPGTETACNDESHVVRHHVTTPFFVRMALRDELISKTYIDQGLRDLAQKPLTQASFAVILQGELTSFAQLPSTAEEGAAMTKAPGVFAPGCADHDTLHDTAQTFGTTITPPGGSPQRVLGVFANWRDGALPTNVLTQSPTLADTTCP